MSREHDSVQRNPIIADVFHRAGLIEKWGRGTNRVIAMCRAAGIRPPEFAEVGPSAMVAFRVNVAGAVAVTPQVGEQVSEQVSEQVAKLLDFCRAERSKAELLARLGLAQVYLNYQRHILPCLQKGWIERTIPDKPNSRLQKYRLTERGRDYMNKTKGRHL